MDQVLADTCSKRIYRYDQEKGFMIFREALEAMKRGEKVRREGWSCTSSYLFMDCGEIIAAGGCIALPWVPQNYDMAANDWMVC